jgi:hypothetical protein
VIHFSVQRDHVHLLIEADSRRARTHGLQGLAIRCARAINRRLRRKGRVWAQRFHARALGSPIEMRRGLVYVLLNFRKHLRASAGIDPCSSGPWFAGWRESHPPVGCPCPVAAPLTWLASQGWLRAGGPIDWHEAPAPAPGRSPPQCRGLVPNQDGGSVWP